MIDDAAAAKRFRDAVHHAHLALVTSDISQGRFVLDLQCGSITIAPTAQAAQKLLTLAEAVYGKHQGEARELSQLVAKRELLEDDLDDTITVWQSSARARAADAPQKWVRFGEWIDDQFLVGLRL